MIYFYKTISSCFGIGYLKGGGTFSALVCLILWYVAERQGVAGSSLAIVTVLITVIGIWTSSKVEYFWGKDSSKVVIDEAAGMCVSLLFLPFKWKYLIIAFVLFRFFDIVKPFFIRRLEKWPLGWGVMADDLLAGLYSNLILQLIVFTNLI